MLVTIVSRIYRPEPASASFFLGSVADALLADGHDVDVLTARLPRGMSPEERGERCGGFRCCATGTDTCAGISPTSATTCRWPSASCSPADLPWSSWSRRPPPVRSCAIVCGIRRIPYVYDAADVWSDAADMATGSRTVIRILRGVERFAMRGAAQLVTITQGVVDRVRQLGIDRPVSGDGVRRRYERVHGHPRARFAGLRLRRAAIPCGTGPRCSCRRSWS